MTFQQRLFSSFRDPSGFLFKQDGTLYRQVNHSYKDQYQAARERGLYSRAIANGWMVPFEETVEVEPVTAEAFGVIKPEKLPFISYPYEWCFSQVKDAALLTIDLHLLALEQNMLLKDASIYNVQFNGGRPVFIDHLSFDLAGR